MPNPTRTLLTSLAALCACTGGSLSAATPEATAPPFPGWQEMHVLKLEDQAARFTVGDADGDGDDEIMVANFRQSRVDIYRWVAPDERESVAQADHDDPAAINHLPAPRAIAVDEIAVERLPQHALAATVPGHGPGVLVVAEQGHLFGFVRDDEGVWQQRYHRRLLWSPPLGNVTPRLLTTAAGTEILIACANGVQRLLLEPEAEPRWLEPRDPEGRQWWWVADLDGDGAEDLIEFIGGRGNALRWRRNHSGNFDAGTQITDQPIRTAGVVRRPTGPAAVMVLPGHNQSEMRRYALARGEESRFGRREQLSLSEANARAARTGVQLDENRALLLFDREQPRMLSYTLTDDGWQDAASYPCIDDVVAAITVARQPGTVLLRSAASGEIHRSRWTGERMSFPEVWTFSEATEERTLLALDRVGETCWWVQRVGEDLLLHRWTGAEEEPVITAFTGAGNKVEQALWIGGDRLLVRDKFAAGARILAYGDEGIEERPFPRQQVSFDSLRLYPGDDGAVRVARLANGVLQWLDDELRVEDQVMLDDRQLADYVVLDSGEGWALQLGGGWIHRMEAEPGDVQRAVESVELPGGERLAADPVLGLLLQGNQATTRLSRGRPWELELVDRADVEDRAGASAGEDAEMSRLFVADFTPHPGEEVLVTDDANHRLDLYRLDDTELVPLLDWQVYDDRRYPYGGNARRSRNDPQPRWVAPADLDGDDHRDLVMLCHDRMLVYLGRRHPDKVVRQASQATEEDNR